MHSLLGNTTQALGSNAKKIQPFTIEHLGLIWYGMLRTD